MERRRSTDNRVKKRKAEGDLNNERLAKRLESLQLDTADIEAQNAPQLYATLQHRKDVASISSSATQPLEDEEGMAIDETPYRVFINNLEKEIAEIEAEEEAAKETIFIPDVNKRLFETRIPMPILANKDGEVGGMNRDQALVLYDFPKSLTMDEGHDSVRKAILEARQRARERQKKSNGSTEDTIQREPTAQVVPLTAAITGIEADAEPMETEDVNDVMEID